MREMVKYVLVCVITKTNCDRNTAQRTKPEAWRWGN